MLEISDVQCSVPGRVLFSGLTLTVETGEAVAVIGPSGIGKSTLLSAVLGLSAVDRGHVIVAGHEMTGSSVSVAAALRRGHMGVVFQDGELLPELTAVENVAVAMLLADPDVDAAMDRARESVESVGVPPDTSAADLSGGERQRTAFVRALVNSPDVVLADEPTGSLDTRTRDRIADELFAAARGEQRGTDSVARTPGDGAGFALLIVTHDPTIAERADRVVDLSEYVVSGGSPAARGA